jgi:hypothetical protein
MDENAGLRIYVRVFAGIYLLSLLISGLMPYVLDVRIPSSMGIVPLIIAGMVAAWKFTLDEQRAFTARERHKMVVFSILVSIGISLSGLAVMLFAFGSTSEMLRRAFAEVLADISTMAAIIIMAGLFMIYALVLYFIYGWLTSRLILRYAQKSQ